MDSSLNPTSRGCGMSTSSPQTSTTGETTCSDFHPSERAITMTTCYLDLEWLGVRDSQNLRKTLRWFFFFFNFLNSLWNRIFFLYSLQVVKTVRKRMRPLKWYPKLDKKLDFFVNSCKPKDIVVAVFDGKKLWVLMTNKKKKGRRCEFLRRND